MANELNKDFNKMLHKQTDMPKIQILTDENSIQHYGGSRMFFAPPLVYNEIMRRIPEGSLTTVGEIRVYLARINDTDFTEPITAGSFISIAAWASEQRKENLAPYWRTLKSNGELNPKYPGGIEHQKKLLERPAK